MNPAAIVSIELQAEAKISLAQAAKVVPPLDGKRPSVSTLWRWTMHGIHGVRLEHVWIGRKIATSREALDRFFAAAAQARLEQAGSSERSEVELSSKHRGPEQRRRDVHNAVRRLRASEFSI